MSLVSLERKLTSVGDTSRATPAGVAERGSGAPLRIVHVLRAPLGGLFRHVVDLTREQTARGHHVGLILDSSTGGETAVRILGSLESSLRLGVFRTPMRRAPHPADLTAFRRVRHRLRDLQPDVIHGHGSKGGLYARLSGFTPGLETAVRAYTPHGGSFNQSPGSLKHRLYMATERALIRRTDLLLFESAYISGRFDHFVGPRSTLRRVIPNGIASTEFVPVLSAENAVEFLYVGELRAAKGIDTLLCALAELSSRSATKPRLILVGSGPDVASLQQQARMLGLAEQVAFPGPMPARTAFPLGRVLVVPSRAESLPYIVLEAAGARIPMVCTNVGGIPEIFGPHSDRLIPADNVAILADAMMNAWHASTAERDARTQALAAYVQQRFCFEIMVTAVIDGYREALLNRGR